MINQTATPRECRCGCGAELPPRTPGKLGRNQQYLKPYHGERFRQRMTAMFGF